MNTARSLPSRRANRPSSSSTTPPMEYESGAMPRSSTRRASSREYWAGVNPRPSPLNRTARSSASVDASGAERVPARIAVGNPAPNPATHAPPACRNRRRLTSRIRTSCSPRGYFRWAGIGRRMLAVQVGVSRAGLEALQHYRTITGTCCRFSADERLSRRAVRHHRTIAAAGRRAPADRPSVLAQQQRRNPSGRDRLRQFSFGGGLCGAIHARPLLVFLPVAEAHQHAERVGIEPEHRVRAGQYENALGTRLADRRIALQLASCVGKWKSQHRIERAMPLLLHPFRDDAQPVGPLGHGNGAASAHDGAQSGDRRGEDFLRTEADLRLELAIRLQPLLVVREVADLFPEQQAIRIGGRRSRRVSVKRPERSHDAAKTRSRHVY